MLEYIGQTKQPKQAWGAYRTAKIIAQYAGGRGRVPLDVLARHVRSLSEHRGRVTLESRYMLRDYHRKIFREDPKGIFYTLEDRPGTLPVVVSASDQTILGKTFQVVREADYFTIRAEDLRTIETFRRACFRGAVMVYSYESPTHASKKMGLSRRTGFSFVKGLEREPVYRELGFGLSFSTEAEAVKRLTEFKQNKDNGAVSGAVSRFAWTAKKTKPIEVGTFAGGPLKVRSVENGRIVFEDQFLSPIADLRLWVDLRGLPRKVSFFGSSSGGFVCRATVAYVLGETTFGDLSVHAVAQKTEDGFTLSAFAEYTGETEDLTGRWSIVEPIGSRYIRPEGYRRRTLPWERKESHGPREKWVGENVRGLAVSLK